MSPRKSKKVSEKVLELIKSRSRKAIEFAKTTMLAEKVESKTIYAALKYYVSNWEVCTFPGLFSIACEAVGTAPDKTLKAQAATALLAAALDIHDDIIDRSLAKHGVPTIFGKFGQDVSLLLGNAFFVDGFTLIGKSIVNLPDEKAYEILEAIKKLMFEVGIAHALELDFRRNMTIKPENYLAVLKMKAATAEVSMQLGAIIGEGAQAQVEALRRYGRILGMLATLRDEFIDVYESEELRQRVQNECLPLPVLYALQGENSRQMQRILRKGSLSHVDAERLLDLVLESKEVKRLKKKMGSMAKEACNIASQIRKKEIKDLLIQLSTSSLEDLQ